MAEATTTNGGEAAIQWRGGRWQAPFFTIWGGQSLSLLGSALVGFALVWWLTQETGSATILALGQLMYLLPQILLGPLAGTLVDRWNRRWVMLGADALTALATLGLAALFAGGQVQVWHILALNFIRSLGGAFHWPAMQASTSLMVPDRQLARVSGLNQTLQALRGIAAPPLGALLLAVLPIEHILLIDVATAAFAILPLLFIDIPQPVRQQATDVGDALLKPSMWRATLWREMREGLAYVRGWPGLMAIMGLAMVLNFFLTPAFSLSPLLVTDHFGGGAPEYAVLDAAFGVGMLGGGLLLTTWGGFKRRMLTSLSGIVGMGIGVLLMGVAPAQLFPLAVVGLAVAGFANPLANGPLLAIMQSSVAPDMQGRVFSLLGAASQAMTPLGLLVIGPIADAVGVRAGYLVGGVVFIVLGTAAMFVPALTNIEQSNKAQQARQVMAAAPEAEAVTGEAAAAELTPPQAARSPGQE